MLTMPDILITTFGSTWAILPEIIGFVNYPEVSIFKKNSIVLFKI